MRAFMSVMLTVALVVAVGATFPVGKGAPQSGTVLAQQPGPKPPPPPPPRPNPPPPPGPKHS
jgi:hypothetical protein